MTTGHWTGDGPGERSHAASETVGTELPQSAPDTGTLASRLTREASHQTYLTVKYLADRDRVTDAYRAYAYFRWLDDRLDAPDAERAERLALLSGQQRLLDTCMNGRAPIASSIEEQMLVDLLRCGDSGRTGLMAYVHNLMTVMAFDEERRDRLVSNAELEAYQLALATGVTEALHHFIGNGGHSPVDESRYQAATGAHIAHMLRDTYDDVAAGYYNIPRELLDDRGLSPADFDHDAYRDWVGGRVTQARRCFEIGRSYLRRVTCCRCRVAGFAYIKRFEGVLDTIEADGYLLRSRYPRPNKSWTLVSAAVAAMTSGLGGAIGGDEAQAALRN